MTKERNGKFNVDGVLALVLLGVFAVCVLLVLMQGARSYERLTLRGQDSYNERTAAQYVVTRIRQADVHGAVSLGEIDNIQTLELRETINGETYVTRVYCCDGYIRELFSAEKYTFEPDAGQYILPAQKLVFMLENGLLTANIVQENGESVQVSISIRSGGAAYEE